jgi:Cu/Ag efflux protein CusF
VCSRCIVSEHRGHRIADKDETGGGASSQQNFVRKSQILVKKIDASTGETTMFEEELNEIAE